MASMPPINDWVNVAAVRSELLVTRPESAKYKAFEVINAELNLTRCSREARRGARGLEIADRREWGPTQGQHSTTPLAHAQRMPFRALVAPRPCLPMLRTSG